MITLNKINCDYCKKEFKRLLWRINNNKKRGSKNYCSREHAGKAHSKNISGKNHPMHDVHRYGRKAPNYKDGRSSKNELERKSAKNKQFIQGMLRRDNYTCQTCGKYGGDLEIDHIMPWSSFKDLRQDPENARTLCKPCHVKYGANPHANPPKLATFPVQNM